MANLKPPLTGYSLWLLAEPQSQQKLQLVVDDLAADYGTSAFKAHLTLLGLLEKTAGHEKHLIDITKQLARECTGEASSEIVGIGQRNAHLQSMFGISVPNHFLCNLNQIARRRLGHKDDPPYMPHWSFLYGDLDQKTKKKITSRLADYLTLPWTVKISQISLVSVQGHPDEWKEVFACDVAQ